MKYTWEIKKKKKSCIYEIVKIECWLCHVCPTSWNSSVPDGCILLEFYFTGEGVVTKIY
jgi:hypothetical protein